NLDLAAFMGMRHVFCFDEHGSVFDHANIRLALTCRLLTVGFLDQNFHDDLVAFLSDKPQDPSQLAGLVTAEQGYRPALVLDFNLTLAPLEKPGGDPGKRWARLLYEDFPPREEFFTAPGT